MGNYKPYCRPGESDSVIALGRVLLLGIILFVVVMFLVFVL